MLFGARAELEGEREDLVYGPPRNQQELTDRVVAALLERATAETANDRPVLVDLGQTPANPTVAGAASGTSTTTETPPPVPVPDPVRSPERTQSGDHPSRAGPQPRSVPERVPVAVTDEQRQQWRDLVRRSVAARVADDQDTYRAVQAERRDLMTQLGPERVELLRPKSREALRHPGPGHQPATRTNSAWNASGWSRRGRRNMLTYTVHLLMQVIANLSRIQEIRRLNGQTRYRRRITRLVRATRHDLRSNAWTLTGT